MTLIDWDRGMLWLDVYDTLILNVDFVKDGANVLSLLFNWHLSAQVAAMAVPPWECHVVDMEVVSVDLLVVMPDHPVRISTQQQVVARFKKLEPNFDVF